MTRASPTRRAQRRRETMAEIKSLAMRQVTAGGVESLSLNAITRTMSMSPAAIYRYFATRDELLAALVVDAYDSLADALQTAARDRGPGRGDRLVEVARAYRSWALEHPHAYRLVFQTTSGSGSQLAPDRTVAAAQRSMDVFLDVLSELGPPADAAPDPALAAQVAQWGTRSHPPDLPVTSLHLGLVCWSRLHGLISLELGQHLTATGIDPALLYDWEVQVLLDSARTGAARSPAPG